MRKILITAFEPFGGEEINASAEVLRLLPDEILNDEVQKLLLPVIFGEAGKLVLEQSADFIFLLGEAGSRAKVTPERRAVNLRNARIPDNAGNQPVNVKICPSGPNEYQTKIPLELIIDDMNCSGYEIEISDDAGAYVCNDTFYLVGNGSNVPVDFIHVPHKPEEIDGIAKTVYQFIKRAVSVIDAKSRLTLKQFRRKHHLTQKELAARIGITPSTLSKYESGEWVINQSIIDKIWDEYGENIRPLLHGKRQPKVWKKVNNQ